MDEHLADRENMLRNAVKLVAHHLEPVYGIIRMKAEAHESYPSENYDWRQSGLYKLILKKYIVEKEKTKKAGDD